MKKKTNRADALRRHHQADSEKHLGDHGDPDEQVENRVPEIAVDCVTQRGSERDPPWRREGD